MGWGGVPVQAAAEKANVELLVLHAMDKILKKINKWEDKSYHFTVAHHTLLWILAFAIDGPVSLVSLTVEELYRAISRANQHQVVGLGGPI